ncbi:MAG: PqqD family protein, partial [Caldilineaceae bacterium]|nr:PqqD family protein [Caldilineaceae bacterium]
MNNPSRITTVQSEPMGDGLAVYNTESHESFVLNATTAVVWQQCDGETTPQQLTQNIQQKFNLAQQQAERLMWMALDKLANANLLRESVAGMPHLLSRRQMLQGFAVAGLSLALVPIVAPVTVQAADGDVFPTVQCVQNNGDGTYTAFFGYINLSSNTVTIPSDSSKNMFTS